MLSSENKSKKPRIFERTKKVPQQAVGLEELLPHDRLAEQAVLGAIIIQNSILLQVLDILSTDDFFSPANQYIFANFPVPGSTDVRNRILCDLAPHGQVHIHGNLHHRRAPKQFRRLERTRDGCQSGADTRAEGRDSRDQHDGDEGDNESILDETLTFLTRHKLLHQIPHLFSPL